MLFERSEDVAQLAVSKNAAATLGIAIPASISHARQLHARMRVATVSGRASQRQGSLRR